MKDPLVLLVLLGAFTAVQVSSQPYQADSDGNCVNPAAEYLLDGTNLCCRKCHPGQRLKEECSETTDTVCEPCPSGQYMEGWNYAPNCFSCPKCKTSKGLQDGQTCSSTTKSRCVCQPGRYCILGFDRPYCTACNRYTQCKAGYGVSVQGTENTNVRCGRCPNGTFSASVSSTEPCRPHTNCHGRAVMRQGDSTSDTICEGLISTGVRPETKTEKPRTETLLTPARTPTLKVSATADYEAPRGPTNSTLSFRPSVSEAVFNSSTKTPPPSAGSDSTMAAVIAGVVGFILFLIAVVLLFLCVARRKDAASLPQKVDANGNCENGNEVNHDYSGATQLTSFTEFPQEQQCLLQNGEAYSDDTQRSNNVGTLVLADGCSSQESIGPLRSHVALASPCSALSEPMTLLSNAEPFTRQSSVPPQSCSQPCSQSCSQPCSQSCSQPCSQSCSQPCSQSCSQPSSQPTSPQVISPVASSPHVNVNITFHIGNGSCGTPSVTPPDLMPVDSKLPVEEEEMFSNPQQEDGKHSLMSVEESESYSTSRVT